MKEDNIKRLVKKSIVSTTDDFTDQLIKNLEKEQEKKVLISISTFKKVISTVVIVMLLVFYFVFNIFNANLFGRSIVPLILVVSIMILLILNHILRLNHLYSVLKDRT